MIGKAGYSYLLHNDLRKSYGTLHPLLEFNLGWNS
jgi:hypothetical protein